MTQYNSLNVKLSNSQLSKFKLAIKNETEVVLRLSSNMIGDNENNFPQLLLTNRQVANIRKAFANNSSVSSIHQLSKMIQSGGFLGRLLGPLLKTGLPLIKNVIKPLAKSVLIPLGLTAAASAANAGIHKKILGSGHNNTLISNNEIEDIIKIVKSLEDSGLLLKIVTQTVPNEVTKQEGGFLNMLLGTLGAILWGNLLTGRGIYRAGKGKGAIARRQGRGKGINRAGKGIDYGNKIDF